MPDLPMPLDRSGSGLSTRAALALVAAAAGPVRMEAHLLSTLKEHEDALLAAQKEAHDAADHLRDLRRYRDQMHERARDYAVTVVDILVDKGPDEPPNAMAVVTYGMARDVVEKCDIAIAQADLEAKRFDKAACEAIAAWSPVMLADNWGRMKHDSPPPGWESDGRAP